MLLKLQSGFTGETLDGLFHLGGTVSTNLPGMVVFATLKPTPAEILTATNAFGAARNMFGPGRKQAVLSTRLILSGLLGEVAVNASQMPGVTDTDLAQIGLRVLQKPGPKTTQPPG